MLNDRTNLHYLTIASSLTPANQAMERMIGGMESRFNVTLGSSAAAHQAALLRLHDIAYAQASTMAYADAFLTIMAAFAVATPLVLLMRRVTPPARPVAAAH